MTVSFPSNPEGRALVTLEEEGRVLKQEWVAPSKDITRYTFKATPDMAPNIYVHVTFIQPHLQTANDLPIRLYGVVPVLVEDPTTHLTPVVTSADSFKPGQKATISVKEAAGREMTYTLAIVDEGLLRINRYTTPDPWNAFYKKEASILENWDLYDLVAGAFSGQLDSLLAIGGGEDQFNQGERKANRFPPLVRFVGPVSLKKGATNTHTIDIPQYIGAVRLMVVAAHAGAYGTAERSVTVKSDLMLLPTLPRVLSVGETADFPVSVISGRADLKIGQCHRDRHGAGDRDRKPHADRELCRGRGADRAVPTCRGHHGGQGHGERQRRGLGSAGRVEHGDRRAAARVAPDARHRCHDPAGQELAGRSLPHRLPRDQRAAARGVAPSAHGSREEPRLPHPVSPRLHRADHELRVPPALPGQARAALRGQGGADPAQRGRRHQEAHLVPDLVGRFHILARLRRGR